MSQRPTKRKGASRRPNRAQQQARNVRRAQTVADYRPVINGNGTATADGATASPVIANESIPARASGRGRRAAIRPVARTRMLTRAQEYSFIRADLRRMLITIAGIVALMLVLLYVIEM